MKKGYHNFVAIDDSKRTLVLGSCGPERDCPRACSIPNEAGGTCSACSPD